MQLLYIVALLLSAVAAHPDSWRPWQDEKIPPAGGPKMDSDNESVTQTPDDVDGGSGGDLPEWDSDHPTHEMPPWFANRPTGRPGKGNPRGPMKGTDGNDRRPGRPSQVSTRSKRQAHGAMRGPSGHSGRPKRPSRGNWWPNRRNPSPPAFSPIFKVDNVTFQNITGVTLKEGENVFLMPMHGGRGHHHHHHHRGGKHGPPENGQYVKLIYNATEPNQVSVEYGVLKPMSLGAIVADNPEEDY
ncbi:uncharacterized protein LOC127355142 [Dicentrarchus labrax]|uniref:uncharacterized protein LOC127355142 n=1 Tax=Dicentrarchus labrax TaxID=13489 RepID=UPI0021F62018|nr:uncharacterized protein LOC127355142 [Dicentrarchus labrax]XP_051241608.1 uncharacterized protein LOC127355142 [Dicentrarchus labrax]